MKQTINGPCFYTFFFALVSTACLSPTPERHSFRTLELISTQPILTTTNNYQLTNNVLSNTRRSFRNDTLQLNRQSFRQRYPQTTHTPFMKLRYDEHQVDIESHSFMGYTKW
ncbi:hypothetical protein V8C42DRAFT_143331 [Trichoderma barbatum]